MSFEQNLMNKIDGFLVEKGLQDFYVNEIEFVPKQLLSPEQRANLPDVSGLSQLIDQTLATIGLGGFLVKNLNLFLRGASPCKVDETPVYVCKQYPDGSYRCSIDCKKATP